MNENKIYISGLCPYCPATLDYAEDQKAVVCSCCKNAVPTRLLRPLGSRDADGSDSEESRKIAENVTSASLGLIYLDNFCDSFDWREFAHNAELSVRVLDAIAEISRLKFSSDPLTYLLAFRCTAIPVLKKIDGLDVLEVEIIDNYKSDDISDAFEYTDLYCDITHTVASKRDGIIAKLEKDVALAKKFGIDAKIAEDLDRSLAVFRDKVGAVTVASGIESVPGYLKAKELRDGELYLKFRDKGIDAEKTYEKAIGLIAEGNVDSALHLLGAINGYKDSAKLIARYSTIFKFNDELFEMAGKCYFVKDEVSYFNVSEDQPEEAAAKTQKLYEIVKNVPTGSPVLSGISKIIHCYGSRIFFVRGGVNVCAYESRSANTFANVKVLDEAPRGDYVIGNDSDIFYSSDKSKFFFRKKLREVTEKRGCFGRRKKSNAPKINRQNNYSVVLIDMDAATSKVILPEVVDIMDFYNDKIFYTKVSGEGESSFRIYDINTGEDKQILNANCIIHNVDGDRIIYSRWAPSKYNLDLYSISVSTGETTLIDTNISGYYTTYGGKVFYTVGTGACARLYSAGLDGENIVEVMEDPGSICEVNSGWLYYVSGKGKNACLMKVRADGECNTLVASRFDRLVKMQGGYIYYVSTSGELCVVRSDGHDARRISSDVSGQDIIIDNSKIYYLKRDVVANATDSSDGYGLSLYTTDLEGKRFRKLAHDVVAMTDYDEENIYICKTRLNYYKIETPIDKDNSKTETVSRNVTYYEAYNKLTGKFSEIVHIGAPTPETISYQAGCFLRRKTYTKESVITEMHAEFKRTNVAASGLVHGEEMEAARREQEIVDAERESKRKKRNKKPNKDSEQDTAQAQDASEDKAGAEGAADAGAGSTDTE